MFIGLISSFTCLRKKLSLVSLSLIFKIYKTIKVIPFQIPNDILESNPSEYSTVNPNYFC